MPNNIRIFANPNDFEKYIKTEKAIREEATIMFFFLFGLVSFSSFLTKVTVKTGIITKATNNDEDRTIIRVMGIYFINSPIKSFQNNNGKNAASVVAVDEIMATAISPTANLAASNTLYPWSIKR